MTVIVALTTGLLAACSAGLSWLAHLLRRDRGLIWRPGDDVPEVPDDAPIRHWAGGQHDRAAARC